MKQRASEAFHQVGSPALKMKGQPRFLAHAYCSMYAIGQSLGNPALPA